MSCGKKDNPTPPDGDTTPPQVSYAYPTDSAAGLPRNTAIYVMFSEPMDQGSAQGAFTASGASGAFHWFGNSMVFVPASPFPADDTVRFAVSSAAEDVAGNGLAPALTRWFLAGASTDNARPTVSALDPAAGASGVAVGTTITMGASEPILQFITGNIGLADSLGNPVAGNTTYQDSLTVAFNPTSDLAHNTRYTLTVDTILRDRCWNRNETATWWFRTEIDASAPTVLSVSPADGSTTVSLKDSVVITFSEPMDTASARAAFSITPAVSGTFSWSGATVLKFKPVQVLAVHRGYSVAVSTGAMDLSGNHLAAPFSSFFTTDRAVYAACTQAGRIYVMARSTGDEMQQISVTNPVGLAYSPDGTKLYVLTGGAAGSLKVLDPQSAHAEVRSISPLNQPYDLDVSMTGARVALSNYGSSTVTMVDTIDWGSPQTFAVDAGPRGVALGNSRIFAACADAAKLCSYTPSGTFIQSVAIHSASQMMCLSALRDTVYLCEGDQVSAFQASDLNWLGSAATDCQDAVRAGAYLYVSDPLNPRVRVFSPTPSGNIIGHVQDITVGSAPRGLCASSDGSRVYSANGSTGTVSEIGTTTNTVLRTITLGAAVDEVAVSP